MSQHTPPVCPVCENAATVGPARISKLHIYRCPQCGHRFADTRRLGTPQVEELYESAEYGGFRVDPHFQSVIREELTTTFAPRLPKGSRILDVGCGNGTFLEEARTFGYEVAGIDISPGAAQICRERGFDVQVGNFLTMPLEAGWDAITMWDVVEHLPDPASFMRRAYELLRPGGYLIVKTPDVGDLSLSLASRIPALGPVLLMTPGHIVFFSRDSMERTMRSSGFKQVSRLSSRPMRGKRPIRSLRTIAGRIIRWAVYSVAGNRQHYVFAEK